MALEALPEEPSTALVRAVELLVITMEAIRGATAAVADTLTGDGEAEATVAEAGMEVVATVEAGAKSEIRLNLILMFG